LFDGIDDEIDRPTVIFAGRSDLAEIASVRALDTGLKVLGTYDPKSAVDRFLGKPVWNDFSMTPETDFYVITGLDDAEALYDEMVSVVRPEKFLIPDILALRTSRVASD